MTEAQATRAVPYVCPFCGEEDLRPLPGDHPIPGRHPQDRAAPRWHCRACLRVFSVSFYGLQRPELPPAFAEPTTTSATTSTSATTTTRTDQP